MEHRERKPNRLPGYDYASHGAYFVTICTANREPLFWEMDNHGGNHKYGNNKPGDNNQRGGNHVGAANSRPQATLYLSPAGRVVEHAIQDISAHYPAVSVDKYVIMPNHVHAIIRIETTGEDGRMISAPTLSTVIGQMKRWVSKQLGRPIWQKSFYDHIIRNEKEYLDDWNYIHQNPGKWEEDELFRTIN